VDSSEIYRHQVGEATPDEDLPGMLVLCIGTTTNRALRRRRPAVD
jgi:hypothetical protein